MKRRLQRSVDGRIWLRLWATGGRADAEAVAAAHPALEGADAVLPLLPEFKTMHPMGAERAQALAHRAALALLVAHDVAAVESTLQSLTVGPESADVVLLSGGT